VDLHTLSKETGLQNCKILVIDDEKIVRQSIAIYLEDSGYEVLEAEDGKQGVELFSQFKPDLVLCDLRMPELDGLDVLRKLTKISPNTPIIIVSGAGQINDVVEALRLGALDYLVKPITDMAVLENAVINGLKRFQLEAQNKLYRQELELSNRELEKNLELLQQDQDAGRRAQLQLLPEPNETINGFLFQHTIVPSLNLSGDFIDYFKISDRYSGFYIADVSGHGAAAAFVTMTLKSLVNQPLRKYRLGEEQRIINPAKFMKYLNDEFISANLDKHVTLFYGVIDDELNSLTYSVAGQYPAPILFNQEKIITLNEGGFPLGLFSWAKFENFQLSIAEDFKLLMVSDGWLEILSTDSAPADELMLLNFVKANPLNITSLMAPVKEYPSANFPDDITVFLIEKN
jgi:phosphoserine phosphatase RsbU/P